MHDRRPQSAAFCKLQHFILLPLLPHNYFVWHFCGCTVLLCWKALPSAIFKISLLSLPVSWKALFPMKCLYALQVKMRDFSDAWNYSLIAFMSFPGKKQCLHEIFYRKKITHVIEKKIILWSLELSQIWKWSLSNKSERKICDWSAKSSVGIFEVFHKALRAFIYYLFKSSHSSWNEAWKIHPGVW